MDTHEERRAAQLPRQRWGSRRPSKARLKRRQQRDGQEGLLPSAQLVRILLGLVSILAFELVGVDLGARPALEGVKDRRVKNERRQTSPAKEPKLTLISSVRFSCSNTSFPDNLLTPRSLRKEVLRPMRRGVLLHSDLEGVAKDLDDENRISSVDEAISEQ